MNFTHSFADTFNEEFYSIVQPEAAPSPKMLAWSDEVQNQIGWQKTNREEYILSGSEILPGMLPVATRYGGHQFGHWAGQLGDGRAILVGELNGYEIQLKGAGQTPFSRRGDGKAVLRSSLREFLCSEAMFFLGIPTTRALALVDTGEKVLRDMFYDGHHEYEPGAVCTRVAESFVRFGHFEILAADQNRQAFEKLSQYVFKLLNVKTAEEFFDEICKRTAFLMSEWMRVGFVNGVMNTDNMSVLGLTIDYGPYGFLDNYDPDWTPNTTDREYRRYRFSNQPTIAMWNLERLADSFAILDIDLRPQIKTFKSQFTTSRSHMMAKKLGLCMDSALVDGVMTPSNQQLVSDLDALMVKFSVDYTLFFRELANCLEAGLPKRCFKSELNNSDLDVWQNWFQLWRQSLPKQNLEQTKNRMNLVNPAFILRNYIIHEIIAELTQGGFTKLKKAQEFLKSPYSDKNDQWFERAPAWASTQPGCSQLSCSS